MLNVAKSRTVMLKSYPEIILGSYRIDPLPYVQCSKRGLKFTGLCFAQTLSGQMLEGRKKEIKMTVSSQGGGVYMKKFLMVDADKCTGCGVCELTCSMVKHGEYNPEKSYIRVLRNEDVNTYLPIIRSGAALCDLCGACVDFCPEQVLKIMTPQEAILVRRKSTIGTIPVPMAARVEA